MGHAEKNPVLYAIAFLVHILYDTFASKLLLWESLKCPTTACILSSLLEVSSSMWTHYVRTYVRTPIQERMTYDHSESASPALYLQPRVAICHLSPASGPNNLFDHGCQSCAYFNSYILWRIIIKSDAGIFYWNLLIYTRSVSPTNKKRQIPWNRQ